jgi:hypothetical protein
VLIIAMEKETKTSLDVLTVPIACLRVLFVVVVLAH